MFVNNVIFDTDSTMSQVFIAGSATAVAVSSAAAEAGTETMPGYQKLEQDEEQPDCPDESFGASHQQPPDWCGLWFRC